MIQRAFELCESIESADDLIGLAVIPKRGRDSGRICVVMSVIEPREDGFVEIADGKLRKAAKPKKKNIRHLKFTNYRHLEIRDSLLAGTTVTDSMIRACLVSLNRFKEMGWSPSALWRCEDK